MHLRQGLTDVGLRNVIKACTGLASVSLAHAGGITSTGVGHCTLLERLQVGVSACLLLGVTCVYRVASCPI